MSMNVTLNGVPTEDATLDYSFSPDVHPHSVGTWQSSADGIVWTTVGSGTSFTPGDAEAGKFLRVVVDTHDDFTGDAVPGASDAATVVNVNDYMAGTAYITGDAVLGATLTLTYDITDADGIPSGGPACQWQMYDGVDAWIDISGATGTTFTLTQAEVGHMVRPVLSYTDDQGTYETLLIAGTSAVTVPNAAPGGTVTVAGAAGQDATLTLTDTVTDADGIPVGAQAYQWQMDDGDGGWTDIDGATGTTFAPTQPEVGHAVRAVLCYTDGQGTEETVLGAATAAVENVNDAPMGEPVLLGGSPLEGTPVELDVSGVSDADGLGAFAYAWSRDDGNGGWTAIEGAHSAAYTPGNADVGARLQVVASYTDGGGAEERFTLETASAVANVNDAPTGAIVLDGAVVRGGTITADAASLGDADGMGEVSLRWEREDGNVWTPIPGASNAAYTPGAADIGHVLRATATWTDGHGTTETAHAATGTIAPRAIVLPPHQAGEPQPDAAGTYSSADIGAKFADGDVLDRPGGAESLRLADGVLSFGSGTGEAFLGRLYIGLLGREGDAGGLAFLGGALKAGASHADLASVVLTSAEYRAAHSGLTDAAFVDDLYGDVLGRHGGDGERGFWEASLQQGASRAEVAGSIADSAEAREHLQGSTDGVFVPDSGGVLARSLYHTALGREADAPGLVHWSHVLANGSDLQTVGAGLGAMAEFEFRHGGSTDAEFVQSLYHGGLGREAEAGGLDHWVGLLESGRMGRGEVALHVSMTQEARDGLDWAL